MNNILNAHDIWYRIEKFSVNLKIVRFSYKIPFSSNIFETALTKPLTSGT